MNLSNRQGQLYKGQWISGKSDSMPKAIRYGMKSNASIRPRQDGTPDMEQYRLTAVIHTATKLPYRKGDIIILQDGVRGMIKGIEREYSAGKAMQGLKHIYGNTILYLEE